MTELVSSVAADVIVKVGSLVYKEISASWGVQNELEELERTMSMIKAVLLDAEEKQSHNHAVALWLKRLKNAFYGIEDVVDEFVVEDMRRQLSSGSFRRKVNNFLSSSNPVRFHLKMARKIKKIRKRLDEIAREREKFDLIEQIESMHPVRREMTRSFVDSDDIIGREEEKKEIIDFLLHNTTQNKSPFVIPIVGMAGLGKTALAKLIRNNEAVNGHFDLIMWVCVSVEFELKTIVEKIIKATKNESSMLSGSLSNLEIEQLQRKMREKIQGKRYLLFLDDIWNEDKKKWNELEELLKVGGEGSVVIVTTRSKKAALIMGTGKSYNLEGLSSEVCLSIFLKDSFRVGQDKQYPNLVQIGEEIVKKCGGVPLAVRTLASLLFLKNDEKEWINIRDSDIWKLEQNDNDIFPTLRLSYEKLPFHLKRCFAYCSIFEKDLPFLSEFITQFWKANDLLQCSNGNEKFEDAGLRYLKELKSRCFFQDFEDGCFIIFCKMHDLVHDLALSVLDDECLTITSETRHIPKKVRHLIFPNVASLPRNIVPMLQEQDKTVRTMSISRVNEMSTLNSILQTCFSKFKYMRVLHFKDSQFEVLPDTIGNLKHLRYVTLLYNKMIKRIPNSICKLHSLETLIACGCEELEELPKDLKHRISLKFLWLTVKQKRLPKGSIGSLISLENLELYQCKNLENLPEDISALTNLRILRVLDCQSLISLPKVVHSLPALEELTIWKCENLDSAIPELDRNGSVNLSRIIDLNVRLLPKLVHLPWWFFNTSVRKITLAACANLRSLPENCFQDLTSLQLFQVWDCHCLIDLPDGLQNVTSLLEFQITGCPVLEERYQPYVGQDWIKIAHIPKVTIGDSEIIKSTIP